MSTRIIGGKTVEYRSVTGKSGKTREVRVGSKSDTPDNTYIPKEKNRVTTTSGERVINYTDGSKKRFPNGIEPTVITDTNIRDNVIPDINNKINRYAETGQYYDQNGNKFNADGSLADETGKDSTDPRQKQVDDLTASANSDTALINSTLDDLMAQTDKDTAGQIKAIKAQYQVREDALAEVNRRNEMATDTALLLGGTSRYATSGEGISSAQRSAGVMALAQLDAMEQSAIAEAKNAQSEKKYKIASAKLDQVEKLRQEKIKKATELSEKLAEENNTMRENMIKNSRESAIADLFMQGFTEPADMLEMLRATDYGSDITLKEIKETMDIINPSDNLKGLSSDYQTYKAMQKAGEINSKWTYFDYKTALGNASRKPDTSGYDSSGSFDFHSAKMADVKEQARKMFPGTFGSKVTLELTDEQLRDFLNYYQGEVESGQNSLDPETTLVEWSDLMGVKQEKDDAFESKLKKLFD